MEKSLGVIFTVTFAALISATVCCAARQSAAHRGISAFDGNWSVLMQTTRGNCPAAVRAGVQILSGRLLAQDQNFGLDGRVAPSGAIRVMVSAAGQTGSAFGHLSRAAGWGRWRTSLGECTGEWTASRRE